MSKTVLSFARLWADQHTDMPQPIREVKFHSERDWRFDFAFIKERVAVEFDGGQWQPGGGRHSRDSDREKIQEAVALGWRVLQFSNQQYEDDPFRVLKIVFRTLALVLLDECPPGLVRAAGATWIVEMADDLSRNGQAERGAQLRSLLTRSLAQKMELPY